MLWVLILTAMVKAGCQPIVEYRLLLYATESIYLVGKFQNFWQIAAICGVYITWPTG